MTGTGIVSPGAGRDGKLSTQLPKRRGKTIEVLRRPPRADVKVVGTTSRSVVHRRDPTDDDVIDLVTGQRIDQRQRVELANQRVNRPWRSDPARVRRMRATPQRSLDDLPTPQESACRHRSAADRAAPTTPTAPRSTP